MLHCCYKSATEKKLVDNPHGGIKNGHRRKLRRTATQ